ncbi:MAG: PQQ-binding-like beta-propeller repeat protein [Halioglobus sp.]
MLMGQSAVAAISSPFRRCPRWLYVALVSLLPATALTAVAAPSPEDAARQQNTLLYKKHCAQCHGADLRGSAHGNSLVSEAFVKRWAGNGEALLAYTQANMPPGDPSALRTSEVAGVLAFVDQKNELQISQTDGTGVIATEAADEWESWSEAGSIADAAKARGGVRNARLPNTLPPVTDAMLASPDAGDWLSWRRTLDGTGYSPLAQINRRNVSKLKLAWSLAMHDGSNQGTPIVYGGILFLTHPGNIVQALDGATGDLIWEYRYAFPEAARTLGGPTRNIAIYGDKLYLATYDAAVVAIDIHTGEQVWRAEKAPYSSGYTHTAGPVIAQGVVVSGINGCERYTGLGCFITGHDPDTGKELWRTSTIAQPGEPGGDTWGEQPTQFRAGSDTWIAGSYDHDLGLFYIGTSQAKPWVAPSRGMTPQDAALYTNSTLALNPATGEIVWHYQHVPGETIDMEVGFERVLVDVDDEKSLFTVGKDGILWQLDRRTGAYIDMVETLPQNVFESVDRENGRVRYREDIRNVKVGEPIKVCPGIYGGHNWQASAYSPETQNLIIPMHQLCSELVGRTVERKPGGGGYGGDSTTYAMPDAEGKLGLLLSMGLDDMAERWRYEQEAMFLSGALTTGGGLVFVGDLDRYFSAFDVKTGKRLWQSRLGAPLHGFPVTYSANGKQYVAVQTGIGVFRALTALTSPEIYQPANGQAIYVFELP